MLNIPACRFHNLLTEGEADYLIQLVSFAISGLHKSANSSMLCNSSVLRLVSKDIDVITKPRPCHVVTGKATHGEVRGCGQ